MKTIFLFLTIIISDIDYIKTNDFEDVFKEIEWFIDKVEKNIDGESKIYMVKVFSEEDFCFTINYTIGSNFIIKELMAFEYYTTLRGRLILFKSNNKYPLSKIRGLKLIKDDDILNLNGLTDLITMGTSEGYTVCYSYDEFGYEIIKKNYYENSDNIPEQLKIFKTPQNNFIELDSIQQMIIQKFIREKKYDSLKKVNISNSNN